MATTPIPGIYALDPFSTENPTPAQCALIAAASADLANSGFGTVIFASFHVSDTGAINFNNTTIADGGGVTSQLDPDLPAQILAMKTAGQVQKVLISFGGGGCFSGQAIGYWDFSHIQALIAQYPDPGQNPFFLNLNAVMKTYNIDGIDLDLEVYNGVACTDGFPATYSQFQSTLLSMVSWCVGEGYLITAAPYENASFWADLLAAAYTQNGNVQPFAWFNLQNAATFAGQANAFTAAIQGQTTGITDVAAFLSLGLQIGTSDSPENVTEAFHLFPGASSGYLGGWLWNMNSFEADQCNLFAAAIVQGMS